MQFAPHRFVTSSFQSYYDIVDLVHECRSGTIRGLPRERIVDLFGYSIGASLALLLLMRNPQRLFCGGAVLEDANPVSRSIIDSAAWYAERKSRCLTVWTDRTGTPGRDCGGFESGQ